MVLKYIERERCDHVVALVEHIFLSPISSQLESNSIDHYIRVLFT